MNSPSLQAYNSRNVALGHVVSFSQFGLTNLRRKLSDFSNLLGGKFFNTSSLPSLGNAIRYVSHSITCEKVGGIAAWRIIAMMKHPLTGRNRSIAYNPRCPVCQNWNSIPVSPIRNQPVAAWQPISHPNPTRTKLGISFRNWPAFIDPLPQTIGNGFRQSLRGKIFRSNLDSHNSVKLICATLRAVSAAPGHLRIFSILTPQKQGF